MYNVEVEFNGVVSSHEEDLQKYLDLSNRAAEARKIYEDKKLLPVSDGADTPLAPHDTLVEPVTSLEPPPISIPTSSSSVPPIAISSENNTQDSLNKTPSSSNIVPNGREAMLSLDLEHVLELEKNAEKLEQV